MSENEKISLDQMIGTSEEPLVAAMHEGVLLLIINRPQARNALTLAMRKDFARLVERAEGDAAVKAVIVIGAKGIFSAGADIKEVLQGPARIFRPHPGEVARSFTKPIIAAVDGVCVTGALELALSCNFIIASDRSRFADTHAKVGLFPGWGQNALLASAVGVRRARQMSLTGEFIDARTALTWGLVNEVTTPENLLPRALDICRQIGAADPRSVHMQLELYARHDGAPFDVAIAAENALAQKWRSRSVTRE